MFVSSIDPRTEGAQSDLFLSVNELGRVVAYAHGDLEVALGFDIVVTDSIQTYNRIRRVKHNEPDTFSEVVRVPSGKIYPVLVYCWRPSRMSQEARALIVFETSYSDNNAARDYQKKQPEHI